MNKKLMIGAGLVAAVVAGGVQADEGFYTAVNIGMAYLPDADIDAAGATDVQSELGYVLSASFGHRFNNGFRLETEGSLRGNSADTYNEINANGDININALMINGIFDLGDDPSVRPYIGLGGGVASVKYDSVVVGATTIDESQVTSAWQLLLGIGFELDRGTNLTLGYRYLDPQDVSINGTNIDHSSHDLEVGLRFEY